MFLNNFILFLIPFTSILPSLFALHTSSFFIEECKDSIPIYSLEGRIMTVRYFTDYYEKSALNLQACILSDKSIIPIPFDLEQMLWNVTVLELRGVIWPSMQNMTYDLVEKATLWDTTPVGVWGPCSRLKEITIHDFVNLTLLSPDWLKNCTELRDMTLLDLTVKEIQTVLDTTLNVTSLDLWRIKDDSVSLIAKKQLFSISRDNFQWLRAVRVWEPIVRPDNSIASNLSIFQNERYSAWEEVSEGLLLQLSMLPRLEEVSISDKHFDFCTSNNVSSVTFASVESLTLTETNTTRLCLKKKRIMPKLKELNILYSTFITVEFSELFSAPRPILETNFNGIKHGGFSFNRDDYIALTDISNELTKTTGNVTFFNLVLRMECNCKKTLWFARALQERLVTAPDVLCTDGTAPKDLPCEELSCKRVPCAGGCVCCSRGMRANTSLLADCRDAALTALTPALLSTPHLTTILAPHNQIHSLPDYMPDSLIFLDLTGNNVWKVGASAVDVLFSQPKRRVRLSDNDIFCSCENKLLITTLQDHHDQVEDFDRLICGDNKQKLIEVNVTILCESFERNAAQRGKLHIIFEGVIGALVVAVVFSILGVILYNRRRDLQIFLFSKGWCLSCVQEEDVDSDRRYDVFLSFCHADTEIVLEKLLPVLDGEYSVCMHLRDWYPGEMIPTHIASSVTQSRRTIVVLSRNFVRSLWGRLEFQTARMSGLIDGQVRVVVIILDDVLEKGEVEGDLQAYIRLNTYLKWGDPWFWEKLRYALPHKPMMRELRVPSASLHRINIALGQYMEIRQIEGPIINPNTTSQPIIVTEPTN